MLRSRDLTASRYSWVKLREAVVKQGDQGSSGAEKTKLTVGILSKVQLVGLAGHRFQAKRPGGQ